MTEPFVFGIPLIARAAAPDWSVVERLFGWTLAALLAQTDRDFRVILACHDVPRAWATVADDPRFRLAPADWPVEPPSAANDDGGAKKWRIKQAVREDGGGLLMFLDADDWIARDLVATARATLRPGDVGAVVLHGHALDYRTMRATPFPLGDVYPGPFHGLCGSSTIGRIMPGAAQPHRIDPHAVLGSHHEWPDRAEALGLPLARLDTSGVYLVGTGQNHSEEHGPFTDWRTQVTAAVRARGQVLTADLAQRYGQDLADLHSAQDDAGRLAVGRHGNSA